jgi:hypothetical protein
MRLGYVVAPVHASPLNLGLILAEDIASVVSPSAVHTNIGCDSRYRCEGIAVIVNATYSYCAPGPSLAVSSAASVSPPPFTRSSQPVK